MNVSVTDVDISNANIPRVMAIFVDLFRHIIYLTFFDCTYNVDVINANIDTHS